MATSGKTEKPRVRKRPVIAVLVFIAVWMIGIACGEPSRVLEQAVQICLSCIGIG
ncbi:MAG: hypothetical protein KKG47_11360 [Proteobacteria bacterium]|nr:hypothetical protein [Pseudomonadota bacterium]MBU1739412.1 hypothetical protein [Pseudomonadota bacterium]